MAAFNCVNAAPSMSSLSFQKASFLSKLVKGVTICAYLATKSRPKPNVPRSDLSAGTLSGMGQFSRAEARTGLMYCPYPLTM